MYGEGPAMKLQSRGGLELKITKGKSKYRTLAAISVSLTYFKAPKQNKLGLLSDEILVANHIR